VDGDSPARQPGGALNPGPAGEAGVRRADELGVGRYVGRREPGHGVGHPYFAGGLDALGAATLDLLIEPMLDLSRPEPVGGEPRWWAGSVAGTTTWI